MGTSIFSFFHNVFYSSRKKKINLSVTFILSSANSFNLEQFKIFSFGKETMWGKYVSKALSFINYHTIQDLEKRDLSTNNAQDEKMLFIIIASISRNIFFPSNYNCNCTSFKETVAWNCNYLCLNPAGASRIILTIKVHLSQYSVYVINLEHVPMSSSISESSDISKALVTASR